jgi:hypothetical protein
MAAPRTLSTLSLSISRHANPAGASTFLAPALPRLVHIDLLDMPFRGRGGKRRATSPAADSPAAAAKKAKTAAALKAPLAATADEVDIDGNPIWRVSVLSV